MFLLSSLVERGLHGWCLFWCSLLLCKWNRIVLVMYICMYKKTPFRPSVSFDNVLVNYTFVVIDRAIIDCFGSCILCFFERIIQCTLYIIY